MSFFHVLIALAVFWLLSKRLFVCRGLNGSRDGKHKPRRKATKSQTRPPILASTSFRYRKRKSQFASTPIRNLFRRLAKLEQTVEHQATHMQPSPPHPTTSASEDAGHTLVTRAHLEVLHKALHKMDCRLDAITKACKPTEDLEKDLANLRTELNQFKAQPAREHSPQLNNTQLRLVDMRRLIERMERDLKDLKVHKEACLDGLHLLKEIRCELNGLSEMQEVVVPPVQEVGADRWFEDGRYRLPYEGEDQGDGYSGRYSYYDTPFDSLI
ncbi:hypothetical protein BJ508DRAFT_366362 [Ascobolus immersus RN42]|uniref:Uncharacterized protein n=1 Tax=Ascobolus immersus RN42 TaxID=1160509 RepID=A0A3N4HWZ6_ASCIM|nr:hypothetical protein BJ508DRAFT_366362 [Ascobolus immersus RN42]